MAIEMTNGFKESRESCMSLPIPSEITGRGVQCALSMRTLSCGFSVRQQRLGILLNAGMEWR